MTKNKSRAAALKRVERISMASNKKVSKRVNRQRARRVLNNASVIPTQTGNSLHRLRYGGGLTRKHLRVSHEEDAVNIYDCADTSCSATQCGGDCDDCYEGCVFYAPETGGRGWSYPAANDDNGPDPVIIADVWPKAA